MIISRTPYRISFFGGGSDYPTWVKLHGGSVLSTTIDKYCYIFVNELPPFFDFKYRVAYSTIETVNSIDEIKHPSARECLRFVKPTNGIAVHHVGDLPARSGMGSSSSYTVGLLNALYALKGVYIPKKFLAREAIFIEQDILKENVGYQDQIAAAFGGFNYIRFMPDGNFIVNPVIAKSDRIKLLNDHLMLFYTGVVRTASEIAQSYVPTIDEKRRQLRVTKDLVKEGLEILNTTTDIEYFGELLHEAWEMKRSLSGTVSNSVIDEIYKEARDCGAIGGKLTGAGGGGFLLLFVQPEKQEVVRERLNKLIHVSFKFENIGSQVIFNGC